ncbi:Chemotaxis protein methyltransferase CheR [Sulfitobacter noctilucicola]|uniref:Chemotaxis protein methyltransferase n=1 Tax=Sulfitobacter noctilucicola TaxID=1342301 RepID=A0A7W6M7F6_9RHOB|nr:protein-glutamate O-methyltransferase [Sulfitobacter noctilucicola]KIN65025.1 Chemotaxis protein methyltransferase CheR [Sulfitobacter noctilucicola]MBB4173835.1 chemotaxis protein methyltransferase CheR [Sulfitobacter noctilucicola]
MNAVAHTSTDLDSASFREIAELAYRDSGLILVDEKRSMVQSRLRHRLRALKLPDFKSYCTFLNTEQGIAERRKLISALTTNVTHFFRENHHFDRLKEELSRLLPELKSGGALRIWSAGCSNGQEALSVAMTLLEHVPEVRNYDVRILATDIDPEVVAFAREGIYHERLIAGVPEALLSRYFRKLQTGSEHSYEALPVLKDMIRVNELNLLAPWPMTKKFDVVFCRNVVIYFDVATQETLWPKFQSVLKPQGVLFLGHSERIVDPDRFGFHGTGPTTYRPIAA